MKFLRFITITAGFLILTSFNPNKELLIKIETEFGEIICRLYQETPIHSGNMRTLVKEKFYDGLLFHRIISGFMIQGGDPDSRNAAAGKILGNGGPGFTIPAEINPVKFFHKRGALAAARLADQVNPERMSSGSQFYIVQGSRFTDEQLDAIEKQNVYKFTPEQRKHYKTIGGAAHLDNAYTVFGEVVKGIEIVDRIASSPVSNTSRPVADIKMKISEVN